MEALVIVSEYVLREMLFRQYIRRPALIFNLSVVALFMAFVCCLSYQGMGVLTPATAGMAACAGCNW